MSIFSTFCVGLVAIACLLGYAFYTFKKNKMFLGIDVDNHPEKESLVGTAYEEYFCKTLKVIGTCLLVALLILVIIFYRIGKNINVSETYKITYAKKFAEYTTVSKDVKNATQELDNLKKEQSEIKDTIVEAKEFAKNKESLEGEYSSKQTELEQLKNEVAAKSTELEQLKTGIVQSQEAPKHLPAGDFTVGTDIPAGRYSVSGGSNFVVRSSGGHLKVNTILGGGRWGQECYVCYLNDGDTIEARSACTYTPVK